MGFFGKLFGRKKSYAQDFSSREPSQSEAFLPQDAGGAWNNPEGESPVDQTTSEFSTVPFGEQQPSRWSSPEVQTPQVDPYSRPAESDFNAQVSNKDMQLIMSKLDLINSRLENLNRRLEAFDAARKVDRHLW